MVSKRQVKISAIQSDLLAIPVSILYILYIKYIQEPSFLNPTSYTDRKKTSQYSPFIAKIYYFLHKKLDLNEL